MHQMEVSTYYILPGSQENLSVNMELIVSNGPQLKSV